MASNTPNLNLLKKDPMIDGDDTFNIKTMLNDNWDKIDAAMGQVDIPDASLTVKGKVQLSSATDSAAENQAATPKAIKDAALQAKSYTDQQISLVTETGIPKLVSYPLLVTATADNQKVFEIPLDLFDANTDTLLVAINRAVLDATQYTVTNTVRDGAGQVTQRAKINLLSGVTATSEVTMVVLKNVPIGPDGAINGGVLATGSVPINRVDGLQDKLDQAFQAGNERKKEVVDALVALGVSASTNDSWDTLISKMATVIKATGNADVGDVLAGRTFSNASAAGLTGTMPNRGAVNDILTTQAEEYTIPVGYHNGHGKIKASFANLVADNIRSGVNIGGVVGTLVPSVARLTHINASSNGFIEAYAGQRQNILLATFPAGIQDITFYGTASLPFYQCSPSTNARMDFMLMDEEGRYWYLGQSAYGKTVTISGFNIKPLEGKRSITTIPSGGGLSMPSDFNNYGQLKLIYQIYSDVATTVNYSFIDTVWYY